MSANLGPVSHLHHTPVLSFSTHMVGKWHVGQNVMKAVPIGEWVSWVCSPSFLSAVCCFGVAAGLCTGKKSTNYSNVSEHDPFTHKPCGD